MTANAYCGEPVNVTLSGLYAAVPGGYRYYVTVYNNTDPLLNAHVRYFDLELIPATDLVSPPNWSAWVLSPWFVEWSVGPSWTDWPKGIPPGQSLGGFKATSSLPPGGIQYWGSATNALGDYFFTGTMVPTPIPEPSSLLALGCGLAGVGLSTLRRRRRR